VSHNLAQHRPQTALGGNLNCSLVVGAEFRISCTCASSLRQLATLGHLHKSGLCLCFGSGQELLYQVTFSPIDNRAANGIIVFLSDFFEFLNPQTSSPTACLVIDLRLSSLALQHCLKGFDLYLCANQEN
jgi:hypothetical protein